MVPCKWQFIIYSLSELKQIPCDFQEVAKTTIGIASLKGTLSLLETSRYEAFLWYVL